MFARCPRCGAELRANSLFCSQCGLRLAPSTASSIPTPPSEFAQQAVVPQQPVVPPYPYSRFLGYSVLRVLNPAVPAKGSFWFGMALLIAGLLLTGCPLLLGAALGLGAGATSPMVASLTVSGCFALGLLLPGIILLAIGRPRRQ